MQPPDNRTAHLDQFGYPHDPSPMRGDLLRHMTAEHTPANWTWGTVSHTYLSRKHSHAHGETQPEYRARIAALAVHTAWGIERALLIDDCETLRSAALRTERETVTLLNTALHALRAGRRAVADVYIERAIGALNTRIAAITAAPAAT